MADNPFKRKPAVSRALKQIQDYSAERKGFSGSLDSSGKRELKPSQKDLMKKLKDAQVRGRDVRARANVKSGSGTFTDRLPDARRSSGSSGTIAVSKEAPVAAPEKPSTSGVAPESPRQGGSTVGPGTAVGVTRAALVRAGLRGVARFAGPIGALVGMTSPTGDAADANPPKGKDALMRGNGSSTRSIGNRRSTYSGYGGSVAGMDQNAYNSNYNGIRARYSGKPDLLASQKKYYGVTKDEDLFKIVAQNQKKLAAESAQYNQKNGGDAAPPKPRLRPDDLGKKAADKKAAAAQTKKAKKTAKSPVANANSSASKGLGSAPKYKTGLGFKTGSTIRQKPLAEKRLSMKFDKSRNK